MSARTLPALVLLSLAPLGVLACFEPGDVVTVRTDLGPVAGIYGETGVTTFRGIPFAEPPTGARRFRAPEPVEPWHVAAVSIDGFGHGGGGPDRMAQVLR